MSKISSLKRERIQEEILRILFESGLHGRYTKQIADELARNDEFLLRLLLDLEKKHLVQHVPATTKGTPFVRRKKWILTAQAHDAYHTLRG